jgi:hypothetical protein
MPWVITCLNLLTKPLLGYCFAARKFILQTGILLNQSHSKVTVSEKFIAPSMEHQDRGKSTLSVISVTNVKEVYTRTIKSNICLNYPNFLIHLEFVVAKFSYV